MFDSHKLLYDSKGKNKRFSHYRLPLKSSHSKLLGFVLQVETDNLLVIQSLRALVWSFGYAYPYLDLGYLTLRTGSHTLRPWGCYSEAQRTWLKPTTLFLWTIHWMEKNINHLYLVWPQHILCNNPDAPLILKEPY